MREPGRGPVRVVSLAALISTAGSTAANIAISVFIYDQTGSAVWLSISLLLTFGVTGFLSPFTGIVADRFDRRRLIITTGTDRLVLLQVSALARPVASIADRASE